MKTSGIVRQIDSLGRLVLPIEMRHRMDLETGAKVEMIFDNNTVILKKYQETCIFCDSTKDLISFGEKKVCKECAKKLREETIE